MVLVSISCFTFGSYFSMADKLCTICLFLISSVKPNNEINGEYKTEDKNHKSFASNGYKQGCRETNLHGFPEETQRGRQM